MLSPGFLYWTCDETPWYTPAFTGGTRGIPRAPSGSRAPDFARNGISRGTGFPVGRFTGINRITLSVVYGESYWSPRGTDGTPRLEPQAVVRLPISVHFSMEPVEGATPSNLRTLVPPEYNAGSNIKYRERPYSPCMVTDVSLTRNYTDYHGNHGLPARTHRKSYCSDTV